MIEQLIDHNFKLNNSFEHHVLDLTESAVRKLFQGENIEAQFKEFTNNFQVNFNNCRTFQFKILIQLFDNIIGYPKTTKYNKKNTMNADYSQDVEQILIKYKSTRLQFQYMVSEFEWLHLIPVQFRKYLANNVKFTLNKQLPIYNFKSMFIFD